MNVTDNDRQTARRRWARAAAMAVMVPALALSMVAPAFAAVFPVTPNFDGITKQAGSTLSISWTSTLAPGETLQLWQTVYGPSGQQSSTQLVGGLPQSGTYVVTIPADAVGKAVGYRIHTATFSSYGSSMVGGSMGPWRIYVLAATPTASVPASSPWSLALLLCIGAAVIGAGFVYRARTMAS